MSKIIIEAGSTITKVDEYVDGNLKRLKDEVIPFKKNWKEEHKIKEMDIEKLVSLTNSYKEEKKDVFVCGTSIFRNLNDEEREEFLSNFKEETGLDFKIITSEEENELTVLGATRMIKDKKACVFIGGGGSTEISICDNGKILESVNSNIGVIDAMEEFLDLANDYATSSIDEIKNYIKSKLTIPKESCDILILAGGAHKTFVMDAKIKHEDNTIYEDNEAPFMMNSQTRVSETERFMYEISLEEIKSRVDNPDWWYAARMMCIFILVVMESINAKYIIPTNISLSYGIIEKYF